MSAPGGDARLAAVSAVLLAAPGAPAPDAALLARAAGWCAALFDELLLVGAPPPPGVPAHRVDGEPASALQGLAAALEAAKGERLLALDASAPGPPDLWLALLASPPAEAVAARSEGDASARAALPAVYRRAPALEAARRLLAEGSREVARLAEALGATRLDAAEASELAAASLPEPPPAPALPAAESGAQPPGPERGR